MRKDSSVAHCANGFQACGSAMRLRVHSFCPDRFVSCAVFSLPEKLLQTPLVHDRSANGIVNFSLKTKFFIAQDSYPTHFRAGFISISDFYRCIHRSLCRNLLSLYESDSVVDLLYPLSGVVNKFLNAGNCRGQSIVLWGDRRYPWVIDK